MTYYELKAIKRCVDTQKLRVAALREQAVSLSAASDEMPKSAASSDRVGMIVGQIIDEEEKLNDLYAQLTGCVKAIPDEYIKTLIYCKLVKCWSWARIAAELGGSNTGDGVRMTVVRYKWN